MGNAKKNHYSQILKYTGLFGGIQGLNVLVGLVRNKLVALLLGPQGMGLSALFSSSVKLVSDSTNLGLGVSAVREIADAYSQGDAKRTEQLVCTLRSWCALTAVVGSLLFAVMCPLFGTMAFSGSANSHVAELLLLSPLVGLMAISGGETAILKATRHLGELARLSTYNVVLALLASVPLFWAFGMAAVAPSLLLIGVLQTAVTVACSFRHYPLRVSWRREVLARGMGVVKLGVAFVLAGVMGSGAEFVVRSWLARVGTETAVGLYNAGYLLAVTYVGMIFTAMETDYFPRLSAVCMKRSAVSGTVNRQAEVSVLLIAPILLTFMFLLPVLLPLLFSGKFMPVLGMMQVASVSMLFRALYLPVEYLPLANGDSKSYCLLECVNDLCMVAFVLGGYHFWGLYGTGVGLCAAAFVETVVSFVYTRWHYGYQVSASLLRYVGMQLPLILIGYAVTLVGGGLAYWVAGAAAVPVSAGISLYIIAKKTELWTWRRKGNDGKEETEG